MTEEETNHTKNVVNVILIGCGCPLKSMGWYHAEQLLANRCPSAKLRIIVEPFYMRNNQTETEEVVRPVGYKEFHEWKQIKEQQDSIQFFSSIEQVPVSDFLQQQQQSDKNEQWMVLISGRTNDNPIYFHDCIKYWCTSGTSDHKQWVSTIFLEKPGAPTVVALQEMRDVAITNKVQVYMGFNKNVSSYVQKAMEYTTTNTTDDDNKNYNVTYLHNNAYQESELSECFERNSEGMLKNMLIHELALLVTYYSVTISSIEQVIADTQYSKCCTLGNYTDFSQLKFQIVTKSGTRVNIAGDRCGGDDSVAIITTSTSTQQQESDTENSEIELVRYVMPDEETINNVPKLTKLYPGSMPYFFTQDPDYAEIKERVAHSLLLVGSDEYKPPVGIATIETAIEALQLAEYLTPILQEQLLQQK